MKSYFTDREIWRKIKPWIFLSTYIMLLGAVLINLTNLMSLAGYILSLFRSFLYAIAIAYVLNLPMKVIERFLVRHSKPEGRLQKQKRLFSMLLTLLFALVFLILLGSIVLPSIVASLLALMKNLSVFFLDIVKNIDALLAYLHVDFRIEEVNQVESFLSVPWEKILTNIISFLSGSASGLLSGAGNFISTFMTCFTAFMFSLYLLSGKESFIRQMRKSAAAFLGYRRASFLFSYASKVNRIFSKFIGGQLTEACIIWVLYYTLMRLFQFPYPELISTLIALFSLVPVFGPMLAMFIGAVMMLSEDVLLSVWFIVFFQVISYFEDNVIYPRVVGNSVGLPGLWVLLSIFVLGNAFGVIGMITAVPLTACVYVFFSDYVHYLLKKKHLYVDEREMYETDTQKKKETL